MTQIKIKTTEKGFRKSKNYSEKEKEAQKVEIDDIIKDLPGILENFKEDNFFLMDYKI